MHSHTGAVNTEWLIRVKHTCDCSVPTAGEKCYKYDYLFWWIDQKCVRVMLKAPLECGPPFSEACSKHIPCKVADNLTK